MENEKPWTNFINWLAIRPRTTGFLLFLVLSISVISVSFLRNQILKEEDRNQMNIILANAHQNMAQALKNCYTTTVSLALTLNNDGIPQNFDTVSDQLIRLNPIVSAVQLVPDGVIRYIYPLEGNEPALDLDILNSKYLQKEAKKSVESQKIYFAGPLNLEQGGTGIVGRLPIYNDKKFWGVFCRNYKIRNLIKSSRNSFY